MHITKTALFIVVLFHASSYAVSFSDQYKDLLITALNNDVTTRAGECDSLPPLAAGMRYAAHSAFSISWPIMKLSAVCAGVGGVLQLTRLQEAVSLWNISAASALLSSGVALASLGFEYLPQYWNIDALEGVGASIAAITLAAALIRIGSTKLDKAMNDKNDTGAHNTNNISVEINAA